MFFQASFWLAFAQIIGVNIVLSGDNAVVIAMACRSLAPSQQKKGIVFGSAGAIVLRIILTFFAVSLLLVPYLKLAGAALLFWIGTQLLVSDDEDGRGAHREPCRTFGGYQDHNHRGGGDEFG